MKIPSMKMIEERFHQILETLFHEIDLESIQQGVGKLREEKPKASRAQLAKILTRRAALTTAAVGAGAGAPGGAIGLMAMAPDIANLVVQQSRLVLMIAFLYDQSPDHDERFREVLAVLAVSTGAAATRRGVRYLVERGLEGEAAEALGRRIGGRYLARKIPDLAPLVGGVAGAGLNYLAVQATGRAAIEYYSRIHEEQKRASKQAAASRAGNTDDESPKAKSPSKSGAKKSGSRKAGAKKTYAGKSTSTKSAGTGSSGRSGAGSKSTRPKSTAKKSAAKSSGRKKSAAKSSKKPAGGSTSTKKPPSRKRPTPPATEQSSTREQSPSGGSEPSAAASTEPSAS